MFSSKRKTNRSTKQISISFPFQNPIQKHSGSMVASKQPKNKQANVVILKTKYEFTAQSHMELSLRKHESVKLKKRHGNGWLSVQSIESGLEGQVPASFMEIAFSDVQNPVSSEWLYNTGAGKEPQVDYVVEAKVTHALFNRKSKVWYKLDVVLMSGKTMACGKYHRDFQHLLTMLQREIILPNIPRLIETPPTIQLDFSGTSLVPRKITQEFSSLISQVNLLLGGLLKHSEPFTKSILTQFLTDHRSRKIFQKSSTNEASERSILHFFDSESTILASAVQKNQSFCTTAPLDPITPADGDTASSRLSPIMPSVPTFSQSNVLYSAYLNQGIDSQTRNSSELQKPVQEAKSQMVHSESTRTLDSINSLIQMFELSSSDEEDEFEYQVEANPPKKNSFASTKISDVSSCSLTRNEHKRSSGGTNSSNDASESFHPSKSSNFSEPLTPTAGQSNLFGKFLLNESGDISPPRPKMHQDYMVFTKKSNDRDLMWGSQLGLDRHLS